MNFLYGSVEGIIVCIGSQLEGEADV